MTRPNTKDPDYKNRTGYYIVSVVCLNCKNKCRIEIQKGVTVMWVLQQDNKCPKCGCMTLSAQ